MSDVYYTIRGKSESKFTEKMSRFLAFACHVENAAEAKAFVSEIANKYHDARHVCWAYMIGPARQESISNDNGEPSGTAGKPILGQINSFNLTDVVIAVVRYFGGIKLGTSGLIQAYRESARLALADAEIVEMHEISEFSFTFPYVVMNDVMRVVKQTGCKIAEQNFDNSCVMKVVIRKDDAQMLEARLGNVDGLTFNG